MARFRSIEDVPDLMHQRHPGSKWVEWRPTPRSARWLVRLDFGMSDGQPLAQCIGVELRSFRESADEGWPDWLPPFNESPVELQRRTLRDLPLGRMLDDLGEEMLQVYEWMAAMFRDPIGDPDDDAAAARDADVIENYVAYHRANSSRKRGRGVPDLAAIAAVYNGAKAKRQPATAAVAKWGSVSESTASKWIMRVRQETNLLPPPANAPKRNGVKK